MISRKNKFIFIHIPKTGGNSVSSALQIFTDIHFVGANSPSGFGGNENFWPIDPIHGNIKHFSIDKWYELLGEKICEYFLFCTVRNPIDRAISLYFFTKQAIAYNQIAWLEDYSEEAKDRFIKSEFVKFLNSGLQSQTSYLKSQTKLNVHVMKFEQLVEDFAFVCRRLDLSVACLPRINASRRPLFTNLLDAYSLKLLAEIFEDDFRNFGYAIRTG
jgi:hypothetical protein